MHVSRTCLKHGIGKKEVTTLPVHSRYDEPDQDGDREPDEGVPGVRDPVQVEVITSI